MLTHILSNIREALCPNSRCSSCSLLFWTHILQEHWHSTEATPAGLPFPRAAVGSPSWPFSVPSLLDQTVPSTEMRAHGKHKEADSKHIRIFSFLPDGGASHPEKCIIYHVPSLKNPEESKVLIGLVESSCLSGFGRHIQCLPPLLVELVQIRPFQFPDPCLLAC